MIADITSDSLHIITVSYSMCIACVFTINEMIQPVNSLPVVSILHVLSGFQYLKWRTVTIDNHKRYDMELYW
jgi:hypothetical protein